MREGVEGEGIACHTLWNTILILSGITRFFQGGESCGEFHQNVADGEKEST